MRSCDVGEVEWKRCGCGRGVLVVWQWILVDPVESRKATTQPLCRIVNSVLAPPPSAVSFPRRLPAALCNLTSCSQSHETQSQLAQGASPKIPRLLTVSARFRCALVTGHGLASARNDERVESSKSK